MEPVQPTYYAIDDGTTISLSTSDGGLFCARSIAIGVTSAIIVQPPSSLKIGTVVHVELKIQGELCHTTSATISLLQGPADCPDQFAVLEFARPIRPLTTPALARSFAYPQQESQNLMSLTQRQLELARLDTNHLMSLTRDLKIGGLTLVISALTVFVAVFGVYFAFLQGTAGPVSADVGAVFRHRELWALALLSLPATVTIPLFGLFLDRIFAAHAAGAFTMLLQQAIVLGRFPACYRGWEDAFANLNKYRKYGGTPALPPKEQIASHHPFSVDVKRYISVLTAGFRPAYTFGIVCCAMFYGMPLFSLVSISYECCRLIASKGQQSPTWYIALTVIVIAAFLMFTGLFVRRINTVRTGERSFDRLVVLFDDILHHAPPYHSREIGPVRWIGVQ